MLIKNGTIIDGTKKERFNADVRIDEGFIREIAPRLSARNGEEVIDANGQFVTPGFVDILNHSDVYLTLLTNPGAHSLVHQGITTILVGNCGTSLAPLTDANVINAVQKWADPSSINVNWLSVKEFLDELERHPQHLNVATLVGHATLRRDILGDETRQANEEELRQMAYLLEQGLQEGAFGLSTGLAYSHAKVASPEEINALLTVLQKYGGLYQAHLRDEGDAFIETLQEAIQAAQQNGVPLHVGHLKAMGEKAWQDFPQGLQRIDEAIASGTGVTFDTYPYTRTASILYTLVPDWLATGGKKALLARLQDPESRSKALAEMKERHDWYERMVVAHANLDSLYIGKSLKEIAQNQGTSVEEAVLNLLIASEDRITVFTDTINEDNMRAALSHPASFVASDGVGYSTALEKNGDLVHPRSFGAFPRFLSTYVRDQKLMSFEEAIFKMTFGPAQACGFFQRGKLAVGYYADVTIFDPETISSAASFENPYQYASGISNVLVNGKFALRNGELTYMQTGQILRKI